MYTREQDTLRNTTPDPAAPIYTPEVSSDRVPAAGRVVIHIIIGVY